MTPLMTVLLSILAGMAALLFMTWLVAQVRGVRESPAPALANVDEPAVFEPWWRTKQPFTTLQLSDAFDPEVHMIWDTQMPALALICEGGKHGVSTQRLALVHRLSAARDPELYDGSGFEDWLEFLEKCELVLWSGERVFITGAGAEFVASYVRMRSKAGQAKAA